MSGIYPGVGGNFLADGTNRNFTTVRNKPTGGADCAFQVTYSEMYNPGSGAIIDSNANERWLMGLRRTTTGVVYWATKGLYDIWSFGAIPAGDYAITCISYGDQTQPPQLVPRIRFSGQLTLR